MKASASQTGRFALLLALVGVSALVVNASEREIILDNHFQNGFIFWKSKLGQHVRYAELKDPNPINRSGDYRSGTVNSRWILAF